MRYREDSELVERVAKAIYEQATNYLKPKWVNTWEDLRMKNEGKACKIWIDRAKAALDAFEQYEEERYHNG